MPEQNNITPNSNQAIFGLNTDNIPQQVKPGTLTYALNAQIDSFDGQMVTYQNEQSNVLCSEFKSGYKVIGYHSILEQNRTILFLTNPSTGNSEIGEINNSITCDVNDPTNLGQTNSNNYVNNGYNNVDNTCYCSGETSQEILTLYELFKKLNPVVYSKINSCCTYKTIVSGKCLNFNINYPIHKSVHRIVSVKDDGTCGTEIYWADGLNPRRFINLDDLPFNESIVDCERVKSNVLNCDLLEVQPIIEIPCITPVVVTDGGSLIAGTYQFAIQYTNDKGEGYTAYHSITDPISIWRNRYGLDFNFQTDRSIKLLISNLDTKFKYFNLAVIKDINGVIDPELVGTYEILKETKEVTYSGNNKTQINLTIDDIFQKYPYYKIASEVTSVEGVLMWANLKSDKRTNYQSIANNISVNWSTYQLPYRKGEGYENGLNTALYRGYMRDEVYALEIVFLLKNGQQTDGFHIPGRVSESSDLVNIKNDDVIYEELGKCGDEDDEQPRWKVYNTGTLIGTDPLYDAASDKDCYIGPYQYGKMSYWESEKRYPCNISIWGNLADKPIRHHKFPDSLITHIHDKNPNTKDKEFEHKIFPIGIKIDLENIRQAILGSLLSDEEKNNIVGYRIIRSDRVNNKSVIAKGLLYNVGSYVPYDEDGDARNDQEFFYPNYPFNDLGDDPFLTNLSSINDGGFSLSFINRYQDQIQDIEQFLETMEALLPTILPVVYQDGSMVTIIEITNSELADLQNLIFIAKNNAQALIDALQGAIDYYNEKIASGEPICSEDVDNLTVSDSLYTTLNTSLDNIDTSDAITNFIDIVDYINTNAAALNSHPDATAIFTLRTNLIPIIQQNTSIQASVDMAYPSYRDEYLAALEGLEEVPCDGTVVGDSAFSKRRFTFHSPDTHFYQPFLGSVLKFETVEGGKSIGNFVQVKGHAGHKLMSAFSAGLALVAGIAVGVLFALEPKPHIIGVTPGATYTAYYPDVPSVGTIAEKSLFWNKEFKTLIDNLLPYKNYAYMYNAVGYYNSFNPVVNNGYKQREVDKAYYLLPGYQALGDVSTINNWKRESSVYFRTIGTKDTPLLPNDPIIKGSEQDDNSRVPYSPDKQIYSNVLSYYASHKRILRDQYGEIYSYNTVDTGYCGLIDLAQDYTDTTNTIFGGDIFINRFGLKRKLSFFIDTAVSRPDGADINYSDLSNVGKVKYWYNTSSENTPDSGFKGLMKSILGVPQSNLDGNTNKLFYQNGRIYLYSYGIAYFFVESEVNVEMRQAGNNAEKDYFPNVGTGIPNDWLQEITVPIVEDNYYIYNKTYSKQNKENYFSHLPLTFDSNDTCVEDYSHRVIYSDPNKWRIYKPISYWDFPKNYGRLTGLDTIDNSQVLVRFDNKSFIYNALTAIQTTSGKYAYLGNDDVFKAQPIDFGETDLGYAGSQNHLLLRTQAGHLFIDATRGTVFLINGREAIPISDQGMSKWFDKNLSFKITNYFPSVNTDNHFNGIGITGVWDNKYSRFIITKLDYEPVALYKNDMSYNTLSGKYYYKNSEILLTDTKYFCNRSWTISYYPGTKSWISFHSYIPNYYIGQNGQFLTGKNNTFTDQKSSLWIHNIIQTSYQTFYGKLEPYTLEYPFVYKAQDELIQNVKDNTTILEYYNETDFYEINDGVYFNKAILYNNQQTSGIRNLYPKPKGQLNFYFNYPKFNTDSIDIIYTKSDNFFNYNTIWDVVKNPNNHNPIWIESCENKSIDKVLNNEKLDYSTRSHQKTRLRAKDLKIRHTNDKFGRYKFISKFV